MNNLTSSALAVLAAFAFCPAAEGQVCCLAGDVTVDLRVDGSDVGPFVQALVDPTGMDPRALCAADVNQDQSINVADVGPFVDVLLDPAVGLFDYGPPRNNPEAEQIGLETLGAAGPLLIPNQTYDRIVQDLAAIRAAERRLVGETHSMAWAPNQLIVKVFPGLPHDDYLCLNAFYQVVNVEHLFGDWWVLTFARNLNVLALGAIYVRVPEVEYADPNFMIGGENFWQPTPLTGGVWQWDIDDGFMDCFDGCDCHRYYVFETDTAGNVTLISYQEVGMPWCVF